MVRWERANGQRPTRARKPARTRALRRRAPSADGVDQLTEIAAELHGGEVNSRGFGLRTSFRGDLARKMLERNGLRALPTDAAVARSRAIAKHH